MSGRDLAFVRKDEEAVLGAPIGTGTVTDWILKNLFASFGGMLLTVVASAFLIATIPPIVRWAFIDAIWVGAGREDCVVPGAGACWAFVEAKFAQFMYGRYTIDERWRVNLTAILLIAGLVPMAIPRAPFKRENALFLLVIFPLIALVLLTGGNFDFPPRLLLIVFVFASCATAVIAIVAGGGEAPFAVRVIALAASAIAILLLFASTLFTIPAASIAMGIAALVALAAAVVIIRGAPGHDGAATVITLWAVVAAIVLVFLLLTTDFGLTFVETPLWGGLLVTLVVAIVGIVASMPLGIVLALGRRSKLPIIRFVSIGFIEFVRGVPLITVLFMASVMLPLFLPPGVNFDKLLRALIGVTLFSAAYMAEVIRGGLQAIPKGQNEAALALGLNYWKSMRLIVLPQALKIVIPGIVNSFISLFKDTSLVLIIGIFDLLGIVQQNFNDANWASANTPATGYVFAAIVFWIFCFGMSRYSIYTERRLDTGHRR